MVYFSWLRKMGVALWLVLALVVAALLQGVWHISHQAEAQLGHDLEGQELLVTGVVQGLPQVHEQGSRFVLRVQQATQQGQVVAVPERISLAWFAPKESADAATPSVQPGQRWQMAVKLQQVHGVRNPYGFDTELWFWQQGLGATGSVRAGDATRLLASPTWWQAPTDRARWAVKARVQQWLQPHSPRAQRSAGVLVALIVGEQSAVNSDDWEVFRTTGVAHLMSISGLHITLFAWLAGGLATAWWRRTARWGWRWCWRWPAQQAGNWIGAAAAGLYALFSGWGVPAQRTVLMLLLVAWLKHCGKPWPWYAILPMAAAGVLALDPWAWLQVGFWLSFVAVAVLLLTGAEQEPPAATWWERLGQHLRAFAHQQWLVLLGLTPLAMLMFGQFSVMGVLANAVAVPWVTLVVTPLAFVGVLVPPLWSLADWALQGMLWGLEWLSQLRWVTYSAAMAPLWAGIAGVVGGALLAMRWPWPVRGVGVVLLLPILLWKTLPPAQGQFEVLLVDVGQGGGTLVRTHQHALLYDAGPAFGNSGQDAGQRILWPLLRALDVRPDVLLLSHTDTDHAGGMETLRAAFPQARWLGGVELDHVFRQEGVTQCEAGQHWEWDGVQFEILQPTAQAYQPDADSNALSCVLRISNGQRTALLVGDAGIPEEQGMLARLPAQQLRADLLQVGHHGSKTSSSEDFLGAVQPHWAFIQHGYRNRYGHPHAEVVQRLQQHQAQVVATDQCGAGWWYSHNNQLVCERALHAHVWQHDARQH